MVSPTKRAVALSMAILLLVVGAVPVGAESPSMSQGSSPALALPPLPEWPIIGPILLRLGVIDEQPAEPAPVPDPDLPEYRVTTLDDLDQLDTVEAGERIRVIASEDDINRMAQDVLAQQVGEGASLWVDFAPNAVTVEATADASLVERAGVDLPAIVRGSLTAVATLGAGAANCQPSAEVQHLKVNGWSIGLRGLAQRLIDERTPEIWPAEICVERILLMEDEAAVEGYRVP